MSKQAKIVDASDSVVLLAGIPESSEILACLLASGLAVDQIQVLAHNAEVAAGLGATVVSRQDCDARLKAIRGERAFLISFYWPWIVPRDSLTPFAERTINVHPSLLPVGRGWYPHVHQLIERAELGVTLHQMSPQVDEGPIWSQKAFRPQGFMTAGEARRSLISVAVELFSETWPAIHSGMAHPKSQEDVGTYHYKRDVEAFSELRADHVGRAEDLIRLIAARNDGRRSFIKVGSEPNQYIHIAFSRDGVLHEYPDGSV